MAEDPALHLKLLTIGDSGVGKTLLLLRWADAKKFNKSSMPTVGVDFKIKYIELDGRRVKVQVWDTAGQERFRTITTTYYRNAMGILLIYDITRRDSFDNIKNWMGQIHLNAEANVNKILVGNKCDLIQQRVVTYEEGEALAREFKIKFFETSAYSNTNVDDAFLSIATDVKKRLDAGPGASPTGGMTSGSDPKGKPIGRTITVEEIQGPPKKTSSWGYC